MYHLEIYAKNGSTLLEKITVESSVIPRIGETMYLGELMSYTPDDLSIFLVRDVSYSIGKNSDQNIYVECVCIKSCQPSACRCTYIQTQHFTYRTRMA